MSSATASEVRQWVATRMEAMVGGYGWRESRRILGIDKSASSIAHQGFSVLVGPEIELGQLRARAGATTRVAQGVTVRFAWRVRPGNDQLSDYDDALDAGQAITRHLMQTPTTGLTSIHVKNAGISRRDFVDKGKWLLTDVDFVIDHQLSLSAVT